MKANPVKEVRALEESIRALTDQVGTSEKARKKLDDEVTKLRKVIHEMGLEADQRDTAVKALKAKVARLSKDNDELREGLAMADTYIKESESMSRASWNTLWLARDFLMSLDVHISEPRHDAHRGGNLRRSLCSCHLDWSPSYYEQLGTARAQGGQICSYKASRRLP